MSYASKLELLAFLYAKASEKNVGAGLQIYIYFSWLFDIISLYFQMFASGIILPNY